MMKIIALIIFLIVNLQAMQKLKVGVLAYGTVNWELDVIKKNKLDEKNGFELEVVKLASKNATSIALQSNSVDIIVTDWLWVNTQRANDKDFTFYPYSKATGTLYISKNNKAKNFLDLKGQNIGVAGGAYDKTWLLLRAYSKKKYQKDLKELITPTFAAPPILMKKVLDESLDGAINFWHFNAKVKAKGAKEFISIKEVFRDLGVNEDISMIGWTFRRDLALKNKKLYNSFIKASHVAKDILLSDENEWNRIRSMMKAKDDKTFDSLKDGYKKGVIKEFTKKSIEDSAKIFKILLTEGGRKLVGSSNYLQTNTFWKIEE